MNEWDDAARKAANKIANDFSTVNYQDDIAEIIAKHFANLKTTHEKLVELASTVEACKKTESFAEGFRLMRVMYEQVADPLVKAGIERSKG